MAITKVTGSVLHTALYSKDRTHDIGQLVDNLLMGDTLNGNTVTIGTDGSITVTGNTIIATKTPATAGAAGTTGEIAWDASYIYVCVDTDTWLRAALTWA